MGKSVAPLSSTTRSKHIENLKATIATQDQTISTLQVQFGSLRVSNEAHVASLTDAHTAEVAALKDYIRVLEEQLAQKPSLHHGMFQLHFLTTQSALPRTTTMYLPIGQVRLLGTAASNNKRLTCCLSF